ncbi:MAG: TetR/AcrR family transcriptional regulator [Candidatus Abyssobacteria bacterium SURF_17]|uniref:TetR/AcrR family transcriptional regulator n=1 Tax=Candidatus Abyssobacteria bacterium SURF_17 TaxID=2093361 RepID=A0A419EYR7_9BACT|nr:MAG: TetR/AcrR family transcriptional regulator [Candidatus Abyssubacteria bacterium SURF_17]
MGARQRREEERRARWEQIVDAASTVFSEKGYYGATIEDIENASRLTRGAIYYHFKGKEEIYIAVLARGLRMLRDELRRVSRGRSRSPRGLVVRLIDSYCEFSRQHKEYMRILEHFYSGYESQNGLREGLVDEVNRLILECLEEAVGALKKGVDTGAFALENPFTEAVLMWSIIGSALRKTTDNPRAAFLGIDWDTMKAALKANILARLRAGVAE